MSDLPAQTRSRKGACAGGRPKTPPPSVARERGYTRSKRGKLVDLGNGLVTADYLIPRCVVDRWGRVKSEAVRIVLHEGLKLLEHRFSISGPVEERGLVTIPRQRRLEHRFAKTRVKGNRRLAGEELEEQYAIADARGDFERRRVEVLISDVRVMAVIVHCTSYKTGDVLDPAYHHDDRFPLSIERLSELSGVSIRSVNEMLKLWRFEDLATNTPKIINFTRHATKDGKHGPYNAAPSQRRISWYALGLRFAAHVWERLRAIVRRAGVEEEAERVHAEREAEASFNARELNRLMLERLSRLAQGERPAVPPPPPPPPAPKLRDRIGSALAEFEASGLPPSEYTAWLARRKAAPPSGEGAAEPETSDKR